MHKLPEHGPCFVCGKQNPRGMGVTWFALEDGSIFAEVFLTEAYQGPPGFVHGGASAALLDEAMGAAVWLAGHTAAAVNLNVDYHHPLPLGSNVTVTARLGEQEGKAIHTSGEIKMSDGEVAVIGKGIYVEARHLFESILTRSSE